MAAHTEGAGPRRAAAAGHSLSGLVAKGRSRLESCTDH